MGARLDLVGATVLLVLHFAASAYYGPASQTTYCSGGTCGVNAHCTTVLGRPVCSCLAGYNGDPLRYCKKVDCSDNSDCAGHLACDNNRCIDPCAGSCGPGAQCETNNHVPVCSCPPGHTGNPFTLCRPFSAEELCQQAGCGLNTDCHIVNDVPVCRCRPGFFGSPLTGCTHECESNSDCGPQRACVDFKCENPCSQCGVGAECDVRNHVPVCRCPKNYVGNPLTRCSAECTVHAECPSYKPACISNQCKNPCEGVCGINANCELRGLTPVCSCPRDMTGNPFERCRPFDDSDLCTPNPCGANTKCTPGYDNTNKRRPVCTCLPGFLGNPLSGCTPGECQADENCPDHRACVDYRCVNPCIGNSPCGNGATCEPKNHIAVCTCPNGQAGDGVVDCYNKYSRLAPAFRVYNY